MASILENLPGPVKLWCARAVVGMITADGVITEGELEYLRDTINFLETVEDINEIVSLAKSREKIVLQRIEASAQTAANILLHLASLAVTDGKLDASEEEFFAYVGKKLGFPPDFSGEILTWAKDFSVVNRKRKKILKKAKASQTYTG